MTNASARSAPRPAQGDHHHQEVVPKPLLIGAGVLMLFATIAAAAAPRLADEKPAGQDVVAVDAMRLQFRDDADGGVSVIDFETGALVRRFEPETGGFVRIAMRSLAHARLADGGDQETPFTLTKTARGRMILTDPVSGRSIGLEAFGDDNLGQFADLFDNQGDRDVRLP